MPRGRFLVLVLIAGGALLLGAMGSQVIGDNSASTDPFTAWPESYRQAGVNAFVGKWVNSDPSTLGITKLAITIEYGQMIVQAWGSCAPEDCPWPMVPARVPWCETKRIEATWVMPIANFFLDIVLTDNDRLIVRAKTMYTYDESGRCSQSSVEFVRGDFPISNSLP